MTPGPFSHWRKAIEDHNLEEGTSSGRPDLPPVFQFSQNSLQDYVDCARRFQLRYVLNQRWPAAETEPLQEQERLIEEGAQFHLMVQRHLLGIPAEKLIPLGADLEQWWNSYLINGPLRDLPSAFRQPEVQLSTVIGDQRLMARFDLLCIEPGERAVIVDWKTSRFRPARQNLSRRLQSQVYPFVLAEAGEYLFGGPIEPEQISLIYWFANEPNRPEVFHYNSAIYHQNRQFLSELIRSVAQQDKDIWSLTDDLDRCKYCVYRSLCNRGIKGGTLEEVTSEVAEPGFEFDFAIEDIDEIAF